MTARDDIQRVAAALARPRAGHVERLERARSAMAAESGEVARQLDVFVDRVGDLTTEAFREPALADVHVLAARLARGPATVAEARAAVNSLAPALDRLDANRNPFSHVVRALCCALLARANHARTP